MTQATEAATTVTGERRKLHHKSLSANRAHPGRGTALGDTAPGAVISATDGDLALDPQARIVIGHLLPNVIGPVLVIATINLATAILTEATLSFLGVGLPPTEPSLGTLIRVGNDYLLSGDWWISVFPGTVLALLILSVNLLGDWLRDAFNPKLR